MGKWVGIAMGLVILYYAWLVSRSHDAMLFASWVVRGTARRGRWRDSGCVRGALYLAGNVPLQRNAAFRFA